MYLTRFRINAARREARKLLTSPQAMHAAVLAGFARPEDHTIGDTRTLWRLDHTGDHQVLLYIVSPGTPDLTHLVEQAGWPTVDTWETRPYGEFLDKLEPGQFWAFRLTANPTHDGRKGRNSPDTQRFGAVTAAQQTQWLTARSERYGFSILQQPDGNPNLMVHRRATLSFVRNRGQQPVTLTVATFDGVLQVKDALSLRRGLIAGLGHAKAYGCGLLTLAAAEVRP